MVSAGMFTGCMLDNDEPAGIEAMRTAKAEYYSAEALLKIAEAAYKDAETAHELALVEWQNLQNIAQEYANAVTQAKSEADIAYYQNLLEEQAITHEKTMLTNEKLLLEAQGNYQAALIALEITLATLDEDVRTKINSLNAKMTTAMNDYNAALSSYNAEYAKLVGYISSNESSADTYKASLDLAYNKAVESLANNTTVIAAYEAIIAGYSDITATADAQKTAITTAVTTYNADLTSLQALVDAKDVDKKALEAAQYDYKSSWTTAQSKSTTSDVTNAFVVNDYIKSLYGPVDVSDTNINKYGLKESTIDGTKVYSLASGNKFAFSADALEVKVATTTGTNISIGDMVVVISANETAFSDFDASSSVLSTLNTTINTAETTAITLFNTYYPTALSGTLTAVELENYKQTFTAAVATQTTTTADAKKIYDDAVTAYNTAVTAFTSAATKTQPLLDAINTAGTTLYGTSWVALVSAKGDFTDVTMPTSFIATIDGEATKTMYGTSNTLYGGAWFTYYNAYLASVKMTYATAALALYEDVKAVSDATQTEYDALTLAADGYATTYTTSVTALSAKYDSQISVLVAKVATVIPTANSAVKEVSIRYTEYTTYASTEVLTMSLYQDGQAVASLAGESGTTLVTLETAYNALVTETDKTYFETELTKAKNATKALADDVDTAEADLANYEALGNKDTTNYYALLIEHQQAVVDYNAALMATYKADIESYSEQITALCEIVTTTAE